MNKTLRTLLSVLMLLSMIYPHIGYAETKSYEYLTPGTHSLTLPSGTTSITVTAVGGGGGGAYEDNWGFSVSGGGGAVIRNVAVPIGTSKALTVIVGAGGTPSTNSGVDNQAGNGGPSYVQYNGTNYAYANGGGGGYLKNTGGTYPNPIYTVGAAGGPGATAGSGAGSNDGDILATPGSSYSDTIGRGGSECYNNWILASPGAIFITATYTSTIAVTGITVSPTTAALTHGATKQLTATVSPSNASNKTYSWTSSNSAVATVNASGLVTAVANGTATITATTADGGHKATCTVTVTTPVTGISVTPTTASLTPGATKQLTATVSPSNASNKTYSWTSSNSAVATVNASGLVTAVANGTATITATTADGGHKATCAVTVSTPTSGVTVAPTTATINKGATAQLTATVAPASASNKSVSWASSNTGIATVSASGLVTGVANGTAVITATTASGGYQATCNVTVRVPVTGISVSPATTTLIKGRTQQISAAVSPADATNKNYTWSSTNNAVATVSSSGLVTAIGGGTATIAATTADGSFSGRCTVTVTVPVSGIDITDVSASVNTGSTAQLSYTLTPADATNKTVTWTSSNTAAATVNSTTGVITPVAPGGTEITARTADGGFSDTCFVIVTNNLKPLLIKINTESGKYPGFATIYYKSSGSLITYPGCLVDASGSITCDIPVALSDYKIGVSLLNSLISGTVVAESAGDITAAPLNMIEGDFNADNVINGTDYTLLSQRVNYSGGESQYGKVGDINYDGSVNRLDTIIFNSPISYTGQSRYLTSGYDMVESASRSFASATAAKAMTASASDDGATTSADADGRTAPPAKSILEIADKQNGRYEVSFSQATPKITMFQLALEGQISNLTYALPEGFQLIGQKTLDDMTLLAIGTMEKGGRIIPAATAIIAFEATAMPAIKYGDNHTTMQLATADGIETVGFDPQAAKDTPANSNGGGGCNAGLPGLILLLCATLFYKKKD